MRLYRFSPIGNVTELWTAVRHIHFACYELCKRAFGEHLPNAGNVGVFCHYDDEYEVLTLLRKELTEPSGNPQQKYFRLHQPVVIPAKDDVPETVYEFLYIRKPDPYRHHVGDIDFVLTPEKYAALTKRLSSGEAIKGVRKFDRADLDLIELHDPDIDTLAYISTEAMTKTVRAHVNPPEASST